MSEASSALHCNQSWVPISCTSGRVTMSRRNKATRTYLRKCTTKLLETHPHLAVIGLTVGENMDAEDSEVKEEWGWDTYGRGMHEYATAHPERKLTFIHRLLQSDLEPTARHFKPLMELPNVCFDISHKYSNAHAHAAICHEY